VASVSASASRQKADTRDALTGRDEPGRIGGRLLREKEEIRAGKVRRPRFKLKARRCDSAGLVQRELRIFKPPDRSYFLRLSFFALTTASSASFERLPSALIEKVLLGLEDRGVVDAGLVGDASASSSSKWRWCGGICSGSVSCLWVSIERVGASRNLRGDCR